MNRAVTLTAALFIAGCTGGQGCIAASPEEFPKDERIENAASVRITDSGFGFLNDNVSTLLAASLGRGGVVVQPIPTVSGQQGDVTYTICPDGPDLDAVPPRCAVEIDLDALQMAFTPVAPRNVAVNGSIAVRVQDLPVDVQYLLVPDSTTVVLNGSPGACPPAAQAFASIPFQFGFSVEVDTNADHLRSGYSRLFFESVTVDSQAIEDAIGFCGGTLTSLVLETLTTIVGDYVDALSSENLEQQGNGEAFCEAAPCPPGTHDVDGTCRYEPDPEAECLPPLLGAGGRVPLPSGALDIVLAVGGEGARPDGSGYSYGDLDPVAGGATLGLHGGALPAPLSDCVPFQALVPPSGVPIPDELRANTVEGWPAELPGPHFAMAFSERFANHALAAAHQSGAFCIGVTSDQIPQLSSGTLSLLVASLSDLALQHEPQPVATVVRLATPPRIAFGNGTDIATDPLMHVDVEDAAVDFYVWSLDRYIRFMTAILDLGIPMNLVVSDAGLEPVVGTLEVRDLVIENADLLAEEPAVIAITLTELVEGLAGQLGGAGVGPLPLGGDAGPFGFSLVIPETVEGQGSAGLRRLVSGEDDFLGIFASFAITPAEPEQASAQVIGKRVDPAGVRALSAREGNGPAIRLGLASHAPDAEFSTRVDDGFWTPFVRAAELDVTDPWLRWQGHHRIEVRTRQPGTEPRVIATLPVTIDVEPPAIDVARDGSRATIAARDLVSDATLLRWSAGGSAWSSWAPAPLVVDASAPLAVEARDDEGNIAVFSEPSTPAIESAACVQSPGPASPRPGLLALAAAGALAARRRRGRVPR